MITTYKILHALTCGLGCVAALYIPAMIIVKVL